MTAATRLRVQRRPVHGVLLLDKPVGLSSNQALQKARWLLRATKAGHTGTLDPLASGVLPLCFGAATKLSQFQLDATKTYETVIRLGIRTSTGDAEGEVLQTRPVECTLDQVKNILNQFRGEIKQLPPMYSALKKDGKPLYAYARQGQTVERSARQVQIHALELLQVQLSAAQPFLALRVSCSKGTYIRTLGEDISQALGCVGHLIFLRRIETGGLHVDNAITLQQLEELGESEQIKYIMPAPVLLQGFERFELEPAQAGRFLSGVRLRVPWTASINRRPVAVYGKQPEAFLGIAHICQDELIADRLLSPIEIQQTIAQQQ